MHQLQMGRDIEIISLTEFKATVIDVTGRDRLSTILEKIQTASNNKDMLIFCQDPIMFNKIRQFLQDSHIKVEIIDALAAEEKVAQLAAGGNSGRRIILSNIKGATGIDYKGDRDLIIADAENWTYSDLLQGTARNNRDWDGKDSSGEELPEGRYTYRITATDQNGDAVSVE